MGRIRTSTRADRTDSSVDALRVVRAVTASCLLFLALGITYGEKIGTWLQNTPTTTNGWLFIGWLIAGPPYLIAFLCWHERARLRPSQRRNLTYLLALWIGLSMFVLPARVHGVDVQFGTAALIGDPLSAGWIWGALANLVGFGFGAVVLVVLRRSVKGRPTRRQREMTIRLLERAWLVLLLASVGFALYAPNTGFVHTGT